MVGCTEVKKSSAEPVMHRPMVIGGRAPKRPTMRPDKIAATMMPRVAGSCSAPARVGDVADGDDVAGGSEQPHVLPALGCRLSTIEVSGTTKVSSPTRHHHAVEHRQRQRQGQVKRRALAGHRVDDDAPAQIAWILRSHHVHADAAPGDVRDRSRR